MIDSVEGARQPNQRAVRLRILLVAVASAIVIAMLPSATTVRAAGAATSSPASSGLNCIQHGDQQGENAGCGAHTRPGN